MSFVRPEVAAGFRRWRERVLWTALGILGLGLIWQGFAVNSPLALAVGVGAALASAGLLRTAVRRVRLSRVGPAEGVLMIDEARIAYLGPHGGGFVDVPTLAAVEIIRRPGGGDAVWRLVAEDGAELVVPVGARGAEALPDALSALADIDAGRALEALAAGGGARVALWRKGPIAGEPPLALRGPGG